MHAGVSVSAAVIDAPQVKLGKQTRMDHVRDDDR